MSLNLNVVHLAGRLTADPVRRDLTNGPVVNCSLAINRKMKDKEESVFVDIEAWGKTAELLAGYCAKGTGLYVQGRLKLDKWQTKEGEARQRLKVVADFCQFTTPRDESATPPSAEPERTVPAAATGGDEPPF